MDRIVILDGYTDEPAGLGVPPYIGVYPRLVAGAVWLYDKSFDVRYYTIDSVRKDIDGFISVARESKAVVFIAGAEVPGRYIGGKPVSIEELERLAILLEDKTRILVGPIARFGAGLGGGSIALQVSRIRNLFDYIVPGDPELFIYEGLRSGFDKADPCMLRRDYSFTDKAFRYGARIIQQHPNYGWNLVVEIETYRGCPRYVVGGCSFCIEPRYGCVLYRSIEGIVREIEALDKYGARHYRLGKQPDILVYHGIDTGKTEFPKPNPSALEKLFHGIRCVARNLRVLHIDNVNPGTVAHHPRESIEALKIIVKYHAPGDVAALGIESFDPRVVRSNNLKVYPDEALEAIRIINKVGVKRGWNGLPELLPGINLLYGLPGETRETYRINYMYLRRILEEGLLVRRINIRRVTVLQNTPLWSRRDTVEQLLRRHDRLYRFYRRRVMEDIDKPMLKRILPRNTIVKYLYTEKHFGEYTIARQPGSYPIVFYVKGRHKLMEVIEARVTGYKAKSVIAEAVS